jgi:Xaa-Pro aminopeptidase
MHIMTVEEKIAALRRLMEKEGWDAAVIPGSDPHGSEYLPERWQQRQFISGFTGSYGTVVVTRDHAGIWTDTRYFIQVAHELSGTEFVLHKMRVPDAVDFPEWLAATLPAKAVVGIDGLCMSVDVVRHLQQLLADKQGRVVSKPDYIDSLWSNRPSVPDDKVFILDVKYTGRSREEKLSWLRDELAKQGCSQMLLSSLDQIAWLLNIRSNDIAYNPVAISYLLLGPEKGTLFIKEEKVNSEVKIALQSAGIGIAPYASVTEAISKAPRDERIFIDCSVLNYSLFSAVTDRFGDNYTDARSPVLFEKGKKNATEIAGFRKAYLMDGITQTRFFHWLENEVKAGHPVSELDAQDRLGHLRLEAEGCLGESFEPISAYGENAALPHYMATPEQYSMLEPHGLYLIDSGGHYLYGTTDITRTVPLGPLTDLEREDYTLVLKAMIGLTTAIFPRGTHGANIDVLARIPLWKAFRNFGHGTGHGVGHLLCVHEGPQDFRQNLYAQPMLTGMVTSCEPGVYREHYHGVRHEDMLLCIDYPSNEFGDWQGFETLTCTYIDPSPLLTDLMTREEVTWLNDFNAKVYARLLPHLDKADADWLRTKTLPLQ